MNNAKKITALAFLIKINIYVDISSTLVKKMFLTLLMGSPSTLKSS